MWEQPGLFSEPERTYTVSAITAQIRALLEREPLLQNFWVEGELSNVSRASSGHIYFTLKDAGSQLSGVVWRSQAQAMRYLPKSGDKVLAHGRIGVYEQGGRYQFYADAFKPAGRGSLYEAFEPQEAKRLLNRLEFHYTPKHGSWLNMAEIEFSVLFRQCLDRRIPDAEALQSEIAAWQDDRNTRESAVNWRFSTDNARIQFQRAA